MEYKKSWHKFSILQSLVRVHKCDGDFFYSQLAIHLMCTVFCLTLCLSVSGLLLFCWFCVGWGLLQCEFVVGIAKNMRISRTSHFSAVCALWMHFIYLFIWVLANCETHLIEARTFLSTHSVRRMWKNSTHRERLKETKEKGRERRTENNRQIIMHLLRCSETLKYSLNICYKEPGAFSIKTFFGTWSIIWTKILCRTKWKIAWNQVVAVSSYALHSTHSMHSEYVNNNKMHTHTHTLAVTHPCHAYGYYCLEANIAYVFFSRTLTVLFVVRCAASAAYARAERVQTIWLAAQRTRSLT